MRMEFTRRMFFTIVTTLQLIRNSSNLVNSSNLKGETPTVVKTTYLFRCNKRLGNFVKRLWNFKSFIFHFAKMKYDFLSNLQLQVDCT